jgi:hypothetical protein
LTVYFDQNDPQECRALEMAKLLATKHGRRKQAIVALLDAMYSHYQETGELLSATAIQNAVLNANGSSRYAVPGLSAAANPADVEVIPTTVPRQRPNAVRQRGEPPIERDDTQLVSISSGGKASAEETAQNFINSMGGMSFFD